MVVFAEHGRGQPCHQIRNGLSLGNGQLDWRIVLVIVGHHDNSALIRHSSRVNP